MLEVHNLKKRFKQKLVLDDVSFNVNAGEIVAYLGPNGAGKTTTIKCICGLNTLTGGRVELNKHKIGVVFDENGLYPAMTAFENLLFFAKLSGTKTQNKRVEEMLNIVDLSDVAHKKVKTFSKGMKRRLALARILIFDPEILILDEPFDGIDTVNHNYMINFIRKWVKQEKRCIMFSSHNMPEVESFCDRAVILNDGKIIEDDSVSGLLRKNIRGVNVVLRNKSELNKAVELLHPLVKPDVLQIDGTAIFVPVAGIENKALNQEIHDIFVTNKIAFDELAVSYLTLEKIYMEYVPAKEV